MADQERANRSEAKQRQESRQSAQQGAQQNSSMKGTPPGGNAQAGIGSSQGQDTAAREPGTRPSAGTADIERTASSESTPRGGNSEESLVQESTGAYKERP
jgi:hypothetical protein